MKNRNQKIRRVPVNGTFEVTVRCNLRCKMCLFRHDDSENSTIMKEELTTEEWIRMAEKAAEAGTVELLITGGEPMLRPDFCEMWEGIYKQGFLITLYTNATMVTPKIMETLKKYPPHKIGVTVYGSSKEIYQKVCNNASAFERMLQGVKMLLTLPSVMEYRTTIIKDNFEDAEKIEELVHENFDKDALVTYSTTVTKAVRGGCANVEGCRLDAETELKMHLNRKLGIIKSYVGDDFSLDKVKVSETEKSLVDQRRAPLLGCPAGRRSYTITWDGKMIPCQMLGLFETMARGRDIMSTWEELGEIIEVPESGKKCKNCEVSDYCDTCYATRYAETGSLDGCNRYLLESAKAKQSIYKMFRRMENGSDL